MAENNVNTSIGSAVLIFRRDAVVGTVAVHQVILFTDSRYRKVRDLQTISRVRVGTCGIRGRVGGEGQFTVFGPEIVRCRIPAARSVIFHHDGVPSSTGGHVVLPSVLRIAEGRVVPFVVPAPDFEVLFGRICSNDLTVLRYGTGCGSYDGCFEGDLRIRCSHTAFTFVFDATGKCCTGNSCKKQNSFHVT